MKLVACLVLLGTMALAQQPCELPPSHVAPEANMFNDQQSADLGDVVMRQFETEYKIVHDPALNARLQEIAEKLRAQLGTPAVQIALIDANQVNAYTFPGGRIFVTRKLVAFVQSEDELAAVLAHELGHVRNRDAEAGITQRLKAVLNVTSVGDRNDIEAKYHQLLDNWRRKRFTLSQHMEREQTNADEVAMWGMARAGYKPEALISFWDRTNNLKGETGSWVSDFFGTTKPGAKRLRAALDVVKKMPATCVKVAPPDVAAFKAWQAAVNQASRGHREEALHGVVSKAALHPHMPADLWHIKFSPDGKWLLAQDSASVYVLSRSPLQFKHRIDALSAKAATFSPDSKSIAFYNDDLRVEQWDVASGSRNWVKEVVVVNACYDHALSPSGNELVCVDSDLFLRVIDVATSKTVYEKKNFIDPRYAYFFVVLSRLIQTLGLNAHLIPFAFSPDGHYVIAGRGASSEVLDLQTHEPVKKLGHGLAWKFSGNRFAFFGPDKIVALDREAPDKSGVFKFPSGEQVARMSLGSQELSAPTHGEEYVILRPIRQYPVGVMKVSTGKMVIANRTSAFDIYDEQYASERMNGEIALYEFSKGENQPVATVELPKGPLGTLRAAAVSQDFTRIAVSQRTRGGAYDMKTGAELAFGEPFGGVFIDSSYYVDLPKQPGRNRVVAKMDTKAGKLVPLYGIETEVDNRRDDSDQSKKDTIPVPKKLNVWHAVQSGPRLLATRLEKSDKPSGPADLVAYDIRDGSELWSHHFKSRPSIEPDTPHNRVIVTWNAGGGVGRDEVNEDPDLKARVAAIKSSKDYVMLFEVIDQQTGKTVGRVLVDTANASFRVRGLQSCGDYLLITDNQNRTTVYRISDGKQLGHVFGAQAALSSEANLVSVENQAGEVSLYSLPVLAKVDDLTFESRVAFQQFSPDGKQLFVLTADQTAYRLDVASTGTRTAPR